MPLHSPIRSHEYGDFVACRQRPQERSLAGANVMPALGDNTERRCYMDDLYVYLRARPTDARRTRRGLPRRKTSRGAYTQAENSCMGRK